MSAHRIRRTVGATVLGLLAPLVVLAVPAPANGVHQTATLHLDGTATQAGRSGRNGIVSACGASKVYPGIQSTGSTFNIATTTFVAPSTGCLTISQTAVTGCNSGVDVFLSVYVFAYHPTLQSAHYLGDAGASGSSGVTFGVDVIQGQTYVVLANTTGPPETCDVDIAFDMADDTTPPDTVFSPTPPTKVRTSSVVLGFSGQPADDTAGFQCQVDGAAFAACTNPLELDHLTVGSHTVAVRAVDAVGNIDPTPASATFLSCDLPGGELSLEAATTALTRAEKAVAKTKHLLAKAKTHQAKVKARKALRKATTKAAHAKHRVTTLQRGIHACAE